MSIPCEVAVKCVLPPIRAMIAKELMSVHGLKQEEAANLLGVSQPAISLYSRKIRGKAIDLDDDPDVVRMIGVFACSLAKGDISRRDLIMSYCKICRTIRAKGLLCKLHKAFDPMIDIEKCELCLTASSLTCI